MAFHLGLINAHPYIFWYYLYISTGICTFFWGYLYMTKKLTQKQENFARLFVELGNQSEAYRQAYETTAGHETVNVSACKLLKNANVAQRVSELRENIAMKHEVTVDSLLQELEEARTIALTCETPQSSAAISATMGKAKLCGLDKQIIDHTSSDGSMAPSVIQIVAPVESTEQSDD